MPRNFLIAMLDAPMQPCFYRACKYRTVVLIVIHCEFINHSVAVLCLRPNTHEDDDSNIYL
jgi:hypothetical protein